MADRDFPISTHNRTISENLPRDLSDVVKAWPNLAAEVQEAIKLMVKSATRPGRKGRP